MMLNHSRRTFIKTATYSSALALSGLSGLALAKSKSASEDSINKQAAETEVVNLINHTGSKVFFENTSVAIAPGEQLSCVVTTKNNSHVSISANNKNLFIKDVLKGHLAISSDYAEFNGIMPFAVFETQAA